MIKITPQEHDALLKSQRKLQALEAGGVDNWEWYGESLTEFNKEEDRAEALEDLLTELCECLCESMYQPSEMGAGFAFDEGSMTAAMAVLNTKIKELNE